MLTNVICKNGLTSNDENYSQVVRRFSRLLDGDCCDRCFASTGAEQQPAQGAVVGTGAMVVLGNPRPWHPGRRKEVTQIISRFAPLKGCQIVSSLGYVHGLFVRNILIMIRTLSFHRRWWVVAYSDLCQIFACRVTEPGTGQENRWLIRSSHREA
jgi:hypothetical protein